MVPPIDITSEEALGRRVFSNRHRNRAQRGIIPYHIFLERKGITKMSVDRIDLAGRQEATVIADRDAAARDATFYGWAALTADQIRTDGRQAVASPSRDNPYHADIILPSLAGCDWEEQKRHAHQLADEACWYKRFS